ncbi:MAG: pilus assembly protein PilM [Candidatus Omnitrophica bacterium]|nr:pilus assembly protein PilM [Candidatus Omnitrophota bacterium]
MAKKRLLAVIDIGILYLKVAILDALSGKLVSATIRDLSSLKGKEERRRHVRDLLKEILHQDTTKINSAALCLSDDHFQIRRIDLPSMPVNEIAGALKWRVKDIISFDMEKASLDFDIINEMTDEDGAKKYDVIFAAVPREVIDEKISILKEAGVETIVGTNVDSFGLTNVISLLSEGKKESTCAVLKIDHTFSTINIYRDGKLTFVRNIPGGLDHIKESIKGPVAFDTGEIELTDEDVEELKAVGIPDNKDTLLNGKLEGKHLLALLRPVLEDLCSEIERSFDYYNTQLEGKEVSKIYIVGDSYKYKNLDKFIRDKMDKETEYLGAASDLFNALVEQKDAVKKEEMPQIVSLIGSGRGGKDAKVNLLPIEYRIEKAQKIQKISIRMVGFAVLSILLVSYMFINARVNDYQKRLVSAKSRVKILYEIKALYEEIGQRERFVRAVRSLEKPTMHILKALSNIIPDNIVLETLKINQDKNTISFNGTVFTGSDVGEVILAKFMESLERSPYFTNINLVSSQRSSREEEPATLFSMNCNIQR